MLDCIFIIKDMKELDSAVSQHRIKRLSRIVESGGNNVPDRQTG